MNLQSLVETMCNETFKKIYGTSPLNLLRMAPSSKSQTWHWLVP